MANSFFTGMAYEFSRQLKRSLGTIEFNEFSAKVGKSVTRWASDELNELGVVSHSPRSGMTMLSLLLAGMGIGEVRKRCSEQQCEMLVSCPYTSGELCGVCLSWGSRLLRAQLGNSVVFSRKLNEDCTLELTAHTKKGPIADLLFDAKTGSKRVNKLRDALPKEVLLQLVRALDDGALKRIQAGVVQKVVGAMETPSVEAYFKQLEAEEETVGDKYVVTSCPLHQRIVQLGNSRMCDICASLVKSVSGHSVSIESCMGRGDLTCRFGAPVKRGEIKRFTIDRPEGHSWMASTVKAQ